MFFRLLRDLISSTQSESLLPVSRVRKVKSWNDSTQWVANFCWIEAAACKKQAFKEFQKDILEKDSVRDAAFDKFPECCQGSFRKSIKLKLIWQNWNKAIVMSKYSTKENVMESNLATSLLKEGV